MVVLSTVLDSPRTRVVRAEPYFWGVDVTRTRLPITTSTTSLELGGSPLRLLSCCTFSASTSAARSKIGQAIEDLEEINPKAGEHLLGLACST